MTFTEKLIRLTADTNKSAVAKAAGLPGTAISNYISRKYIPRADTASKIAKALKVPLDWLADDSQDWPPPIVKEDDLELASDQDLMRVLCGRFRLVAMRFFDELNRAHEVDWLEVAQELLKRPMDEPLPPTLARYARLPDALNTMSFELFRYDPSLESIHFHNELPGRDIDPEELMADRLGSRYRLMPATVRGFRQARELYDLRKLDKDDPERPRRIKEVVGRVTAEMPHARAGGWAQVERHIQGDTGFSSTNALVKKDIVSPRTITGRDIVPVRNIATAKDIAPTRNTVKPDVFKAGGRAKKPK